MIHVTRSPEAPASLAVESKKKSGSYREPDVVARLVEDFHCKCYLCETAPVTDCEVEHLVPKQGGNRPEVKFDWNNLFFSCRHCNSVKNQNKYDGLILDCCREEPEAQLKHTLVTASTDGAAKASTGGGTDSGTSKSGTGGGKKTTGGRAVRQTVVKVVPAKRSPTEEAKRTAELITECFELRNTGIRVNACDVRFRMLSETMDLLYQTLEKYLKAKREGKPVTRTVRTLAGLLDRSAPFAGFTRTYVRQNIKSYPDLAEYVKL